MYLEEYRKARQMALKESKLCQSRGGSPYLPVLDSILAEEQTWGWWRFPWNSLWAPGPLGAARPSPAASCR